MSNKTEKVKVAIEDYLKEVMPYHPTLPNELWNRIDKVLEEEDE